MTCIIDAKSKRHLPARLASVLAISALLMLGTLVAPASAENWTGQSTAEKNRGHRDEHRQRRGNDGRYYSAPPVVYGSPYDGSYYGSPYSPPPVVYGPGIGIGLPGVNINIW
jgi:hypothetical protein